MTEDERLQSRIDDEVAALLPQARVEARRAWQRAPHVLEAAEMESMALLGLAQAAARWRPYCAERGHDPWAFQFFRAFCLRRMRGAMLDYMRSQDWVTRADRARVKAVAAVSQGGQLTEEETAAGAGMSVGEMRSALAAAAARPVSMDAEPTEVSDESDVESSALVSAALEAARAHVESLPAWQRDLVVLRFWHGLSLQDAARVACVPPQQAAAGIAEAAAGVRDALAASLVPHVSLV